MDIDERKVRAAIVTTWDTIADDVHALGDVDLDVAVEMSTDADRMRMYGGNKDAADAFYMLPTEEQERLAREALGGFF